MRTRVWNIYGEASDWSDLVPIEIGLLQVMAPGWMSYPHRLRYQTFDVTDLLQEGCHAEGWAMAYLLSSNKFSKTTEQIISVDSGLHEAFLR